MPLPKLLAPQIAIFADFDGTLVEIAESPDAIVLGHDLPAFLSRIHDDEAFAFALVSGRSLSDLAKYVDIDNLTVGGCHGAEWKFPHSEVESISINADVLTECKLALKQFALDIPLVIEDKKYSLAVHFRRNPGVEGVLDRFLSSLNIGADFKVIAGKFVREIKPASVNKGLIAEKFMASHPFTGRKPVFIGDDVTDEDGFAFVNKANGISIKVGEGKSKAKYRLKTPEDVLNILRRL